MVDNIQIGQGDEWGMNPPNLEASRTLKERLISKTWAIRKSAFDELRDKFILKQGVDEYTEWGLYLSESVTKVLESVLDCFKEFID